MRPRLRAHGARQGAHGQDAPVSEVQQHQGHRGAWQGLQQGVGWVGDKIQQNAQIDRPSILESRDAEMGIESYSAQESWDGVKDAFGFSDKTNQDDGESSAESRADRETHDPTSNDDYSDRMSDKA